MEPAWCGAVRGVGWRLRGADELHLTPVRSVLQMRPSLAYLDEQDARKKENDKPVEEEAEDSTGEEEIKAVQVSAPAECSPVVHNANAPAPPKRFTAEPVVIAVRGRCCPGQVQFKRRESERAQAARKRSHAYLQKQFDDEAWVHMTYHDERVRASACGRGNPSRR